MKIQFIFLACIVCMLPVCKKDKIYTPDCSGNAKSYATDVSPVISSNCALSGCHASGSQNGPGQLTNYNEVNAAKSRIRTVIVNGTMPKNGKLSDDQKDRIVCWIDAGAPNN